MKQFSPILISLLALAVIGSRLSVHAEEEPATHQEVNQHLPATSAEARGRARLLHELVHGTLQVMHRDFFREDEGLAIPSHSLEDVFHEVERSHGVKLRWLVVNADAMNIDNRPQTEFEKQAAKALARGEQAYESVEADKYSYAGTIRLSSQCLKCHVPRRTSTEDRAAGLVITMPLKSH